ncbi:hypothetical protein NM208_g9616 [Fusarium decemcellulare]|uniref:Uncharacterized protein n=1 Tax=Fusarium decemcellulare TaxID=57161 RepID=A0ACC1S0Y8_9HYPO|nr:hypothetical protein NM208_g9616 [Fusarium decemcellulare]
MPSCPSSPALGNGDCVRGDGVMVPSFANQKPDLVPRLTVSGYFQIFLGAGNELNPLRDAFVCIQKRTNDEDRRGYFFKTKMAKTITPQKLRWYWANGKEIALLDVREEGPYAKAHPFWALSVPVSEIEVKLPPLVPRLSAPIVVYDDREGYVEDAVTRISALGYRDIAILEGGLSGYSHVGEVFRDVNVPSKAFGELVEAIRHTPSLPAPEVKQILENENDVVVLDARRYEEHYTMSIPRGQSCPGVLG